ncbi:MAG: bifunctional isocitrate dehydrogenase kinase/phosphatase, partial [Planctomycetes bacterium]|nr:bifunctional isocitrate dehydrogenase kinase/phosphatase [Planctomycetota bacterium]
LRELALTNIFPGDLLTKNFGVSRAGRVIFYDYDEVSLLTDVNFRDMPQARSHEDEMSAEPWFYVGKNDVFPEEFGKFLGLDDELMDTLLEAHGDLFEAKFWRDVQARLRSGEVIEVLPYNHG